MTADQAKVGMRVRQNDWLLSPRGYRDGTITELGEYARGTPHRWLEIEFPGHVTGQPIRVIVSTAQLEPLL